MGGRQRLVHPRGQAGSGAVPAEQSRSRRHARDLPAGRLRRPERSGAVAVARSLGRARGGGGRALRVDRSARPGGPRSRQGPARPRPASSRRSRPAPGRGRPSGRRGRGGDGPARRPGRGRGAHPLRRRDQHLRQPRGAGGGAAHGDLARPLTARPGARGRRGIPPRPDPGRRLRTGPRAAAQRAGMDPRPLPGQLQPLDARRLDRHALVGDAVGPLRRHRGPHARGPRRHAVRAARHASRSPHLDRAQRAGDGAGQRRAPGRDHRGDRARATRARAPGDPRLPVPDLDRWSRGHAGHRRQRGGSLGHARVRRQRDGVLVRDEEGSLRPRSRQVQGADGIPPAPARLRRRRDVPLLHRLRGQRTAMSPASARQSGGSSAVTAGCASGPPPGSSTTRRSSTRRTSGTSCSTAARSPTSRRPRRPGAGCPGSTTP